MSYDHRITEEADEIRTETGSVGSLTTGTSSTLISLNLSNDEKIHGVQVNGTRPGSWEFIVDNTTHFETITTASNLSDSLDFQGHLLVSSGSTVEVKVTNEDRVDSGDYQATLIIRNET